MQNLNELAIRDGLTGLYNRRYFDEVIQRVLNQVSRDGNTVAFLMADLDYFKGYNDAYGHRAGDAVLNTFASVLNALVRRKTDHAFRYGGEEFALLLSPTNRETALRFADRIINGTEDLKIPHASSPFGVLTVSVGVALVRIEKGVSMQRLIDLADQALYEAKNQGRNGRVIKEEVS
jgi:diguanylate cyclase (GGDEF)-like protein